MRTVSKVLLPVALLSLAACQAETPENSYEAGVEDVSGGELVVEPEDPNAVPVNVPETPMTPVPVEEGAAATTPAAVETPAQ